MEVVAASFSYIRREVSCKAPSAACDQFGISIIRIRRRVFFRHNGSRSILYNLVPYFRDPYTSIVYASAEQIRCVGKRHNADRARGGSINGVLIWCIGIKFDGNRFRYRFPSNRVVHSYYILVCAVLGINSTCFVRASAWEIRNSPGTTRVIIYCWRYSRILVPSKSAECYGFCCFILKLLSHYNRITSLEFISV